MNKFKKLNDDEIEKVSGGHFLAKIGEGKIECPTCRRTIKAQPTTRTIDGQQQACELYQCSNCSYAILEWGKYYTEHNLQYQKFKTELYDDVLTPVN